ncbi:MAG: hypothetical protein A2Y62_19020 [Candidatus Fischerbacteria bacterium RBG_13_37_8]|uniref:Phosphotyrosine protein phosphatase I domain-containing protein n=1 Tax=Candidatus Fischerbacteria bacterium RBG_13_37_8 TaxID=1817863 RepID=A0A1F5VK87_9BACT|nr:MAG: hypothetical protein A2Y62_19020 [Candidatus Fischerbacteria bacterium RBG_13_37_8]
MILVICTGNVFRSPLAEAYLRQLLKKSQFDSAEVLSAGLYAQHGIKPVDIAIKLAQADNLDISEHDSQPLSPELLSKSKIILVMEKFHKSFIENIYPDAAGITYLLGSYSKVKKKNNPDIIDPYGADFATCKQVWEQIKECLENFVDTSLDLHMLYGTELEL